MNIEIRRIFTKDADKLPANIQRQLAVIITDLQKAKQLTHIKD